MTPQDPFEAFRRSSHEEREIPYEPEDWKALHQRLDADTAPARGLSPWWMLLLLVPLSGLFYLQQRNIGQQQVLNESLLAEVRTLRQTIDAAAPASRVIISTDTVYQERVVYRERIVYRAAVEVPRLSLSQLISRGPSPENASPGERGDVAGGSGGKMFLSVPLEDKVYFARPLEVKIPGPWGYLKGSRLLAVFDEAAFAGANAESPQVAGVTSSNDLVITSDDGLSGEKDRSIGLLPRDGIAQLTQPVILPKPGPIVVQPFLKRRIARGPIVKGWNLDFVNSLNAVTKEDEPALWTDLRLGARLGKGWSLFMGVAGEYAKFDFEDFDPEIGLDPFPAPSEEFSFENADLRRYTAYGQLGLGWQLPTDGRWSPFIDLAYLRGISSESQLNYHYENDVEQEIVVERPDRYDLPADLVNFGGGMFYSPKTAGWRIGLGGRYQLPLGQDKLNPARLGLDLRLGYWF